MNNKCKFLIVLFLIFTVATLQVQAEKYRGSIVNKSPKAGADCLKPSKNINLALNNVRALLKTNGTMWFESGKAEYEVPKGSGKTSLFSGSLWIGGYSQPKGQGTLHMAAMRFAQVGNDYWTGPLDVKNQSIEQLSCAYYDKFYPMNRVDVERHRSSYSEPDYVMPKSIKDWPAHGRPKFNESRFLAPFHDIDGDEVYDPAKGDYPYYDFKNELCPWTSSNLKKAREFPWLNNDLKPDPLGIIENTEGLALPYERVDFRQNPSYGWDNKQIFADHVLKGDETIFWFLNDRGSSHTETKGASIGLEVRVQAFAFATNDELNKMTFYSYEIINRGSITLYDTYFSQWCDPDLGYAYDDFVGCDVSRGLGYCYNGTEIDGHGEIWAYGANPPAVGLDFFQGPYIDPDGTDNPKFEGGKASINGSPAEQDYCKRFVHHIFDNVPTIFDPVNMVSEELNAQFFVIPGTTDTVRWNDQFAINGVNFGDSIVDNERFGMRAFTYHNNENGPKADPVVAIEYYNYLAGYWKDQTPFSYGGDGYSTEIDALRCDFVFPAGSDFCNWGTKGKPPGETYNRGGKQGNWSERSPNGENSPANTPGDRRFMQSAGPFTLKQGACNYVTVGVPWARSMTGGVDASITLMLIADDKCQLLFEKCFKVLDGPDAPDLTIREYDQKLIIFLSNRPISNNANEDYQEDDENIPIWRFNIRDSIVYQNGDTTVFGDPIIDSLANDRTYRFEGYQIYQVSGPEVGANDLEDPDKARLIRQYDIVNYDEKGAPIGRLINWEYNEELMLDVPKEKVRGSNSGIEHSFEITQDVFATGERRLVNYKTYYFVGVAYAYNQFLPFFLDPENPIGLKGQKLPYLRGRKTADGKSVAPIPAVPHPPTGHGGSSTLHSEYGTIPYITRMDGQGNGGIALDLLPETIEKILSGGDNGDYRVRELKYDKDAGPLNIKVIDPLRVKPFEYTFVFKDTMMESKKVPQNIKNKTDVSGASSYWILTIDDTVTDEELKEAGLVDSKGKTIREFVSQTKIGQYYEQIIPALGLSVGIKNMEFAPAPTIIPFLSRLLDKYDPYRMKYLFCQTEKIDLNNDIVFENNGVPWITGIEDENLPIPSNWVRAGSYGIGTWTGEGGAKGNFSLERLEDRHFPSKLILNPKPGSKAESERAFKDYSGNFGTMCNGTWAPYVLSSPFDQGPHARYTMPEQVPPSTGTENPSYDISINFPPATRFEGAGLYVYCDFTAVDKFCSQPGYNQTMTNLYSVDVVITPDKSKWSRCIVLEACQDRAYSEGGALMHEPRKHTSVNKDGSPDLVSKDGFGPDGTEGMGWFPGYAINLETGERLNIMFSENSDENLNEKFGDLVNGRDMLFNPTSTYAIARDSSEMFPSGVVFTKSLYDELYDLFQADQLKAWKIERVWGGKHYVYVCGSSGNTSPDPYIDRESQQVKYTGDTLLLLPSRRNFNLRDTVYTIPNIGYAPPAPPNLDLTLLTWGGKYEGYLDPDKKYPYYDCGPYDECNWLVQKFKQVLSYEERIKDRNDAPIIPRKHTKMQLFNNVMYTHIPMQPDDPDVKKLWMSCDVTYKLRVTRPYMRYISRWYESPELRNVDYSVPDEFEHTKGYPIYKLSTKGLEPTFHDTRLYQTILDNINIVPNPYYGKSLYETNPLETKVKIINLPTDLKNNAPVTINIYTVSGILVRTLTKGDSATAHVDWDLKNYANIPVASGVYIIHVNCPGIGERMLKFFCAVRQTDLNTF